MNMETGNNEKMMARGKVLVSIPKFIMKKFGKEGYEKWLDAISVEAHAVYILPIKQNDWYPLRQTLIEPCANIAQLFYDWDLKTAAWDLGRFSADSGFKNVKKLFAKVGRASLLINKASEFMASYYKPAAVEIIENNKNSGIFRIKRYPDMDKTVEYHIAGWAQRALEINGCKNVNVDIPKSLTNFSPFSEYRVSWE